MEEEDANSPRAEEFRQFAAEARSRAEAYKVENGVGDDDVVVAYILGSAKHYDMRAREAQAKANRRAMLRAKKSTG